MTFEQKLFNALRPKRKRMRKHRSTRRGPWHNEAKRRWIAQQPCLITGRKSQCAHVLNNGMASKGGDEWTVPLSPEMHDQFDGRAKLPNGLYGKEAFQDYYRVELIEEAIRLHLDWMEEVKHGNRSNARTAA